MSADASVLSESHGSDVAPLRAQRFAPMWLVLSAFAAVYVIWGSTYLGIRIAIGSIPPLLMAGSRFLMAGVVLYLFMRLRGGPRPHATHWRNAAIIGALLLLVGNGAVSLAQKTVPSGIAALMVAATPLWVILIEWLRRGGTRPSLLILAGLAAGFAGVALIVLTKDTTGQRLIDPIGTVLLLVAPLCWAAGSVFSRHASQTGSPLQDVAMQMIAGGTLLLLVGLALGEGQHFDPASITSASAIAFVYLMLFGSLIGYTAYAWLLQVSTPARVSTYAYVNPLVAVFLGRIVLNEPLPHTLVVAGALILAAVLLITVRSQARRR